MNHNDSEIEIKAELARIKALHKDAQRQLEEAETNFKKCDAAYGAARVAPDFDSKAAERAFAAREKASHSRRVYADRLADLDVILAAVESNRNDFIEARRTEENRAKVAQVYRDGEAANQELIAEFRELYAKWTMAGVGGLAELWGGDHVLRYISRMAELQHRLGVLVPPAQNGTTASLPTYGPGIVKALWDRGMLDPGYNGPLDPLAVA